MQKFYVYKITNLVNNKIYIGKTYNIENRWESHKTAAIKKRPGDYFLIHMALNKYGFNNFIIEQIAEYNTEKEALDAEIFYIKEYNAKDRNIGYNMTDGGDGASGYRFSDEQKAKMSEHKKIIFLGEGNPFYGKKHSDESKQLISESHKKIYEENKEKYNELNSKQCALSIEQCIEIQTRYINENNISFEKLAEMYNTNLQAIHKIIHGIYCNIRGQSIIDEKTFNNIRKEKHKIQSEKYKKITEEQEKQIIKKCSSPIKLIDLANEFKTSTVTIRKILKKNNIKRINPPKKNINAQLTEQDIISIRLEYATGNYTYPELGEKFNLSKQQIARIIQYKTYKWVI